MTATTKAETNEAILRAAHKLFRRRGFEATTTREIADAAGLAAGTVFNYYATKERLGSALILGALAQSEAEFRRLRRGDEGLAEELFLLVACGLRQLKEHRRYAGGILETVVSPFSDGSEAGSGLREQQLGEVRRILGRHGVGEATMTVALNLYWGVYSGVLAFWVGDESPDCEDTLALLDQSLRVFESAMSGDRKKGEVKHGA